MLWRREAGGGVGGVGTNSHPATFPPQEEEEESEEEDGGEGREGKKVSKSTEGCLVKCLRSVVELRMF